VTGPVETNNFSVSLILYTSTIVVHVYDYITKLCRQQAEVIQDHDNENESVRGLNLAAVKYTTIKVTRLD
jgi:hypothetical protein